MVSVGSTAKVEGVDTQRVFNAAPAFARPTGQSVRATEGDTRPDISAAGRLKSTTAATLDAADRLTRPQTWRATKATSDDEATVQAVSNQARPGTYKVAVDSVAAAQSTASATFSSIATVIGIGTLKIELGSWNASQSTFATNPNWPKASVTFGPKDTSLERIRDKINAAGIGVIASVVSDATGSRLVLRSTTSGESNAFKVETEAGEGMDQASANALSAMGFDPSKVRGDVDKLLQPARDARVNIDGRQLQSPQNLVEDEATGLSLRIKAPSDTPVAVRVEPDTEAMRDDIQSFAITYNELSRQLSQLPEGSDDNTVQVARDIQSRVEQAFKGQAPEDKEAAGALRAIGIQMNRDGLIEVDPTRLSRALREAPTQVEQLLSASGDRPTDQGLARRLTGLQLSDADAGAASEAASSRPGEEPSGTPAGALFRQKLLEQYSPLSPADAPDTGKGDEELAIQANEA